MQRDVLVSVLDHAVNETWLDASDKNELLQRFDAGETVQDIVKTWEPALQACFSFALYDYLLAMVAGDVKD